MRWPNSAHPPRGQSAVHKKVFEGTRARARPANDEAQSFRILFQKSSHAAQRLHAPAFHLNGHYSIGIAHNEIDLACSLAPPANRKAVLGSQRKQMSPYSAFHQMPAQLAIGEKQLAGTPHGRRHKRCVVHHEPGRRLSPVYLFGMKFGKTAQDPGLGKEVEVMGERGGIACIVQLAEHLAVGQLLSGKARAQFEQRASKAGLRTSSSSSTSFEMVGSMMESRT